MNTLRLLTLQYSNQLITIKLKINKTPSYRFESIENNLCSLLHNPRSQDVQTAVEKVFVEADLMVHNQTFSANNLHLYIL